MGSITHLLGTSHLPKYDSVVPSQLQASLSHGMNGGKNTAPCPHLLQSPYRQLFSLLSSKSPSLFSPFGL